MFVWYKYCFFLNRLSNVLLNLHCVTKYTIDEKNYNIIDFS